MKKILLSSALLMSMMFSAQIDFSSTRFGLTVGGNYSRVKNAHNPSGPRYTMQAGFLALTPIGVDDQFYIQTELTYFGAGETGKDKFAKGSPGYKAVYANSYLSIPISFKGYFSEAESEFFAFGGPRFNFLVGQKVTNPAEPGYSVEGDPNVPGFNGKANGFNFGIGVGMGFSYKRQLEFSVRYDMVLSNTYKGLMKEPGLDENIEKKKSEQVISISLSYIFE
ncbi:MAG: PorT family protein [Flavobacteriaceae bacterium]|jgi:hypothetical protein|nr:PorT family protein [Flavobacteriaceae bacterium]